MMLASYSGALHTFAGLCDLICPPRATTENAGSQVISAHPHGGMESKARYQTRSKSPAQSPTTSFSAEGPLVSVIGGDSLHVYCLPVGLRERTSRSPSSFVNPTHTHTHTHTKLTRSQIHSPNYSRSAEETAISLLATAIRIQSTNAANKTRNSLLPLRLCG